MSAGMPETRSILGRIIPWFFAALVLATGAVPVFLLLRDRSPSGSPSVLGRVPPFALVNRDGRTVTLAELAGRPWVAAFIFTRCGGVCPRMIQAMRRLGPDLPREAGVRRVSISVDPRWDSPEVLQAYADRHDALEEDWLFLTGEPEAIRRLAVEGFRLGLDDGPGAGTASEPIIHSTKLVLVDGRGRLRGYYDALEPIGLETLLRDLRAIDR